MALRTPFKLTPLGLFHTILLLVLFLAGVTLQVRG